MVSCREDAGDGSKETVSMTSNVVRLDRSTDDCIPDWRYSEGQAIPPVVRQLLAVIENPRALPDIGMLRGEIGSFPHMARNRALSA